MNQRIRELDGIRGIAILMVLVWHYITCQGKTLEPGCILSYLHLPTTAFWSGVDLFFVLSGFLIGGIILDSHSKHSFLKVFWIRRICRIFPVLFLLLFLCLIGKSILDAERYNWLFGNLMPWWTYTTFTQNIAMGLSNSFGGHFLGVTWSLAVEEQFYLFAPLMILFLGRKLFLQSLVPLVLMAFVLRLAVPGFHTYVNTIFRMDALLIGVLVAAGYRNEVFWQTLQLNKKVVLSAFFCLLLITGALIIGGGFGYFKFTWFAILYAMFLVVALLYQSTRVTWLLRSRLLCFWGAIAYGLYMYHQAISGLLHGWIRNAPPGLLDMEASLVTSLAFLVSVALSWLSFVTFESFFLRIGKRYKYGANKTLEATATSAAPQL
ncbi:MAG: acyltransferase [Verrucomicrobiota bacterium]